MHDSDGQVDVAEMAGAVKVAEVARGGEEAASTGAEGGVVEAAGRGPAERVEHDGAGDGLDGDAAHGGGGVEGEGDGGDARAERPGGIHGRGLTSRQQKHTLPSMQQAGMHWRAHAFYVL